MDRRRVGRKRGIQKLGHRVAVGVEGVVGWREDNIPPENPTD